MSKQNLSKSSEFIITKPTHVKIDKDRIKFESIKNENIILSAFASTFSNNCVNNDKSHQYFLESLNSLIDGNHNRKDIHQIIYKGKRPFEDFMKSDNIELLDIVKKLRKNQVENQKRNYILVLKYKMLL